MIMFLHLSLFQALSNRCCMLSPGSAGYPKGSGQVLVDNCLVTARALSCLVSFQVGREVNRSRVRICILDSTSKCADALCAILKIRKPDGRNRKANRQQALVATGSMVDKYILDQTWLSLLDEELQCHSTPDNDRNIVRCFLQDLSPTFSNNKTTTCIKRATDFCAILSALQVLPWPKLEIRAVMRSMADPINFHP